MSKSWQRQVLLRPHPLTQEVSFLREHCVWVGQVLRFEAASGPLSGPVLSGQIELWHHQQQLSVVACS